MAYSVPWHLNLDFQATSHTLPAKAQETARWKQALHWAVGHLGTSPHSWDSVSTLSLTGSRRWVHGVRKVLSNPGSQYKWQDLHYTLKMRLKRQQHASVIHQLFYGCQGKLSKNLGVKSKRDKNSYHTTPVFHTTKGPRCWAIDNYRREKYWMSSALCQDKQLVPHVDGVLWSDNTGHWGLFQPPLLLD